MPITIRPAPVQPSRGKVYLCYRGAQYVGQIQKSKNTRTDIHPYKVFKYEGPNQPLTMLATFYTDTDAVKIGPAFDGKMGGKTAAFVYARRHMS